MVYNDLKQKVQAFLQPFADSKTPVSAEDIKAYFAKLRNDRNGRPPGENADPSVGYDPYRREGAGKTRMLCCGCHLDSSIVLVVANTRWG